MIMRFVINPIKPEFVIANRYKYCKLCGCSFLTVGSHPLNVNRSPKWNKILWLIDVLNVFSTVVWLDYDAFLLRPDCSLLDQSADFNIAVDAANPSKYNSGVLVARQKAAPFLKRVWNHTDFGKGESDQRSINYLLPTIDFGVLDPKYNDFGSPPHSCPGYARPKYRTLSNQSSVVVRHRAGQFKGSRTLDGKVVSCAYNQLNLREEAYHIYRYQRDSTKSSKKKSVALLTVIV